MKKIVTIGLIAVPFFAFAKTIQDIINDIKDIINVLVPVLIAIALVVFLVGVIKYVTAGGDEEKRKEARNVMIYGIIGLFVMVAVWGLVNLLIRTFGLEMGPPPPPRF